MTKRRRSRFGLVLFLLLLGAVAWLYRDVTTFFATPLALESEQSYELAPGTPFNRMVEQLREQGWTRAPALYWRALAMSMGVASSLHAGEYALTPGLTPRALLEKMARGQVVQHRFTIVPGTTVRELRAALAAETALKHEITSSMTDADLMDKLGAHGVPAEGRFLPETYVFTRGSSDLALLARAYGAMKAELDKLWEQRPPDTPLKSPDEALTLASIVEKETGRAEERPKIAGVFSRRLKIGMRLQTDPTVIYGMGAQFAGNIRKGDLEADGPYNTYTRAGLPPTPIALPGREALEAAIKPAAGDELYFVSRGDGSHQFSASLAEHEAAVSKFQLHHR